MILKKKKNVNYMDEQKNNEQEILRDYEEMNEDQEKILKMREDNFSTWLKDINVKSLEMNELIKQDFTFNYKESLKHEIKNMGVLFLLASLSAGVFMLLGSFLDLVFFKGFFYILSYFTSLLSGSILFFVCFNSVKFLCINLIKKKDLTLKIKDENFKGKKWYEKMVCEKYRDVSLLEFGMANLQFKSKSLKDIWCLVNKDKRYENIKLLNVSEISQEMLKKELEEKLKTIDFK